MSNQGTGTGTGGNSGVVDFGEVRAQRMEEKRRKTERIFFKNILGVYTVTGNAQMKPLELIEVSENGLSFQVPFEAERPWPKDADDIPIRLYFSQDTYLEVRARILNSRPCIDNGSRYVRYGCTVDSTLSSFPAYEGFVRFLSLYATHAHKDTGDATVFYL